MQQVEPNFNVPSKVGRHVELRPINVADIEHLYLMEQEGDLGSRWRFRGSTPSPEQHARSLWENVLVTFLVVRRRDRSAIGLVTLYNPELNHGTAYIAIAAFAGQQSRGLIFEGTALLIDYGFANWNLRKIYADAPEYNVKQYGTTVGQFFKEEARLKEAEYFGGRFWDKLILTLNRSDWESMRAEALSYILPSSGPSEADKMHQIPGV